MSFDDMNVARCWFSPILSIYLVDAVSEMFCSDLLWSAMFCPVNHVVLGDHAYVEDAGYACHYAACSFLLCYLTVWFSDPFLMKSVPYKPFMTTE